jgi:RNA polymerase sigma-70 factor (ECF subfamily)
MRATLLKRSSSTCSPASWSRSRGPNSYLLGALKHFLVDAHDHARAKKRGGDREILSLDALVAEETYGWEPTDEWTPDRLFERRWALTLISSALKRLEEECRLTGRAHIFATLFGFLSHNATAKTYPQAAELGISEANTRMTVTRLRRRYGELIRAEILETLEDRADLDDELRYLRSLL